MQLKIQGVDFLKISRPRNIGLEMTLVGGGISFKKIYTLALLEKRTKKPHYEKVYIFQYCNGTRV